MFSHIVAKLITYFLSIKMVLLKKKRPGGTGCNRASFPSERLRENSR